MLSLSSLVSTKSLLPKPRLPISSSGSIHWLPIPIPIRCSFSSVSDGTETPLAGVTPNFAGFRLEETVEIDYGKVRIDSWISTRVNGISRARVQSSIKSGLVRVNGLVVDKVSQSVKNGDKINCTISELRALKAKPEDIPIDIVYEDDSVIVVNKPPHMVVHPAPGNATGTLVSGILHHCSLPVATILNEDSLSDDEDTYDEIRDISMNHSSCIASVRPGIVHRLDKGTSGLLVVAKSEHSHAHLSEQFKVHSIQRVYVSLTSGVPSQSSGRIEVPIGRDPNNRIRMTAMPGITNSKVARYAASRYKVIEILAGGGSALVEWRLETGRTHQIRAHAKYLGVPLLGDEVYGGTKNMALSLLRPKTPISYQSQLSKLVSEFERPCLHALALGFKHPYTEKNVHFTRGPPEDFTNILSLLRKIGTVKCDHFTQVANVKGMCRNRGELKDYKNISHYVHTDLVVDCAERYPANKCAKLCTKNT